MTIKSSTASIIRMLCNIGNYMINVMYSRHARLRMVERGISEKEIKEAILKGSKTAQDGRLIASYRNVRVVFRKTKEDCYVITIMLRW
jgi:hypothetical protein